MSTQPPVEVAADSNPFTTLPAEQPLDLRPASVGSESSLHSSTSSNEVVVVNSVKEEEGEHVETATEKLEDTPNKDESSSGETLVVVAEENVALTTIVPTLEGTLNKDEPSEEETLVVVEENGALTTIVPTLEDTPNNHEPSEAEETLGVVEAEETLGAVEEEEALGAVEENDALTTIVPAPEIIAIPEKPAATQVAEAAGHATDKFTSWLPGCLAKTSAFVTRLNKYIYSDQQLRSFPC